LTLVTLQGGMGMGGDRADGALLFGFGYVPVGVFTRATRVRIVTDAATSACHSGRARYRSQLPVRAQLHSSAAAKIALVTLQSGIR
jgi:hypothetical protein